MKVELGDKVRDKVTQFEGIVIGEHQWLTGCRGLSVQPGKITAEGKLSEATSFDEHRLEIIEKGAVRLDNPQARKDNGGPVYRH